MLRKFLCWIGWHLIDEAKVKNIPSGTFCGGIEYEEVYVCQCCGQYCGKVKK